MHRSKFLARFDADNARRFPVSTPLIVRFVQGVPQFTSQLLTFTGRNVCPAQKLCARGLVIFPRAA
jgi:hypothetical protein